MNDPQLQPTIEYCDDLDAGIADYVSRGYRLDMIVPADSPAAAQLSSRVHTVKVVRSAVDVQRFADPGEWITGRAGMEYRDLIPDRLSGRLIASHIRLTRGGEVPDYVHYHKVRFQMIYCVAGAIRVVYEDQGPPFWLLPGDCVLQPPEIRHRVLEAEAGSEVVELGVPAVHETWVEHEMRLPTATFDPNRDFSGQRFVRHIAAKSEHSTGIAGRSSASVTAIGAGTSGLADVRVIRLRSGDPYTTERTAAAGYLFLYCLEGEAEIETASKRSVINRESALVVPPGTSLISLTNSASILSVSLSDI